MRSLIPSYDRDDESFTADAYRTKVKPDVAWHILGWETEPGEDTEWTGIANRTEQIVAVMVGDNSRFIFDPEELVPLESGEWCGGCGQIGCGH